ncbi:MAG: glycosyltransferase family 2 protein [Steroidobacteraceae bacterium]
MIVPTYNRAALLREALASVLAQSRTPLEILVVDDGSTDATRAVVDACGERVRYLHQSNAGVAAARNLGIAAARGEYVALLDSDDVWLGDHLEVTEAVLEAAPQAALVFTNFTELRGTQRRDAPIEDKELFTVFRRWNLRLADALPPARFAARQGGPPPFHLGDAAPLLFFGNFVLCSTVCARRAALQAAGGFPAGWEFCEDWDLFLRLARRQAFAYVERPTIGYRYHGDQAIDTVHGGRIRDLIVAVMERHADLAAQMPRPWRALAAQRMARVYTDRALARIQAGDAAGARADCRRARQHRTGDPRAWGLAALARVPRPALSLAAGLRHGLRDAFDVAHHR